LGFRFCSKGLYSSYQVPLCQIEPKIGSTLMEIQKKIHFTKIVIFLLLKLWSKSSGTSRYLEIAPILNFLGPNEFLGQTSTLISSHFILDNFRPKGCTLASIQDLKMASDASLIISADIHGIICIFDGKLFDVDQGMSIWYFEVSKYIIKIFEYWMLWSIGYFEVLDALKYWILCGIRYFEVLSAKSKVLIFFESIN